MRSKHDDALCCSFCSKPQHEVRKLIAGPSVYICNECIDICNEIIADDKAASQAPSLLNAEIEKEPTIGCSVCHLLVPASECLPIPERGQVCAVCLEAIKVAIDNSEGRS